MLSIVVAVVVVWSGLALLVGALCSMAARGDRALLGAQRADGSVAPVRASSGISTAA